MNDSLRGAHRNAMQLLGADSRGSAARGELILAAVDYQNGRHDHACERLECAASGFAAEGMHGHAAVARYRLGTLRRDPHMISDAVAWIRAEGVVNIERFVRFVAPGFDCVRPADSL